MLHQLAQDEEDKTQAEYGAHQIASVDQQNRILPPLAIQRGVDAILREGKDI
ncbi:hypothetical protein D3C78_1864810 [compost metagenome]